MCLNSLRTPVKTAKKKYLRKERIKQSRKIMYFFLPKLKHELFQKLDKSIQTITSLGAPSIAILP